MFRINPAEAKRRKNRQQQKNIVLLSNSDFTSGPVYLTQPFTVYKLVEDIEFNPIPEFNKIFDSLASFPEQNHHFVLGYFAAIIIVGSDIELDLNGFTLKQSLNHSLQQRFFALIELADRPFLPGQGPANFGSQIKSCNNILIHNGTLGLSSHHGIHGNNPTNITIKNLTIFNHEVAGITINGGNNITIDTVDVRQNYQNIKVTASFSVAIFTAKKLMIKQRENPYLTITVDNVAISVDEIIKRLTASITDAYTDILLNQPIGTINPDSKIYDNSINNGLLDGCCYGITFNSKGLLVNNYKKQFEGGSQNINISNVTISDIRCKPEEHLSLTETLLEDLGDNPQTSTSMNKGAFGDVIRYTENMDENGKFTNKNNPLILAQILAGVKISDTLLEWVNLGTADLPQRIEQNLTILNNLDVMAHMFKGTVGLFLSSVFNVNCNNVTIRNIYNYSTTGKEDNISTNIKYTGARTSGVLVASSQQVSLNNIVIDNIYSESGESYGIYHYGQNDNVFRNNCKVLSLTTNADNTKQAKLTQHIVQSYGYSSS